MQLTIGSKITFVYVLLLLFLCIFGVVILLNVLSVNKLFTFVVEHNVVVIANARQLSKLVVDMESGERGFCITQNDEFLEPYEKGVKEFAGLMAEEKKLVRDDPSQLKRLEKIEGLIDEWQTKAAKPEIAMARKVARASESADYLQDVVGKDVGKRILGEMREIMNEMVKSFEIDGNVKGEFLVESIAKAMIDQEAGEKGYLVTGKETFFEAYEAGKKDLELAFKALKDLVGNTHDRIATSEDIDELERLADIWMAQAVKVEIDLESKPKEETETEALEEDLLIIDESKAEMENVVKIEYGKRILNNILKIIDTMEARFTSAENENAKILLISIAKSMADQETGQRGYIITGSKEFIESYKKAQKAFKSSITKLRQLNSNAYDIQIMNKDIDTLENLAKEWHNRAASPEMAARRTMNESPETIRDIAYLLKEGTGKKILDQIREEFDKFIKIEQVYIDKRYTEAANAANNTTSMIMILIVLSLMSGGTASFFITRGIVQPITKLKEAAISIGEGNLNQIVGVESNDEIGELALCFDKMAKALADAKIKIEQEKIKLEEQKIELEKANLQLGEMNIRKSAFVANVSHELKSPLTIINGSIDLVRDGVTGSINQDQKEMLDTAKNSTERLIRMVTDLLDVSKIEAGKMDIKREKFDMAELVDEVLVTYEKEISNNGIVLKAHIPKDIGSVWGDRDRLSEVIINLLNNAIKYTSKGGDISVELKGSGDEISVAISDTGPGISKDNLWKIFDKFERIAVGKQEGTGLGLAIAKDIVELHEGKIWVESALGKGSKFIFTVPRDLRRQERA